MRSMPPGRGQARATSGAIALADYQLHPVVRDIVDGGRGRRDGFRQRVRGVLGTGV